MKKRYTVQYKPTGAGKTMMRGIGVFHAIFGTVFALIGLSILPAMGLFGLIFVAAGAFFAVNGAMIALGKNGLVGRAYQVETETEEEVPGQPPLSPPSAETHDHIPSTALDAKQRLEQLESLKSAGLIDDREYQQKRQEILRGL